MTDQSANAAREVAARSRQRVAAEALRGQRFADVSWVAETGSTNRDLMAHAGQSDAGERMLVCDFQSQGRGRRDRRWEAPRESSLLMSVLLRGLDAASIHMALNALALAAVDGCRSVAGVEVGLKWPNDLLIGDEKLAGILAEVAFGGGTEVDALVVGMGMNVNRPAVGEPPGIWLSQVAGAEIDRVGLFIEIARRLEHWLSCSAGEVREATLEVSATIGSQVSVDLGAGGNLFGQAVDLAADGRLIIDCDGVREIVAAGDVKHLR